MQFKELADKIHNQFNEVTKYKLFRSSVTGDKLWDTYLGSFKKEHNPIFRDPESSSNNCNTDKSFIRRYGNVVAIDDNNEIITMFDITLPEGSEYYDSVTAARELLKSQPIKDVFFETFDELHSLNYEKTKKQQKIFRLGIQSNHKIYTVEEAQKFGRVEAGPVYTFNHFYADIPLDYVDHSGESQASIIGKYRDNQAVFERGMIEIPLDTLELVRDLINQKSLLNGDAHLYKIEQFITYKKEYDLFKSKDKQTNWTWIKSYNLPIAKFRNELIGTLCVELAEGAELNQACETWNKRVDPANYMKASAPITKRQIEEAKKTVEELGYESAFDRRFATLKDINVDEILHANVGNGVLKTASIFDNVKSTTVSTRHKRSEFDKVETVTIDKFMKDVLPTASSIELFMENRLRNNLVSMTTNNDVDAKPPFKWNNQFSWTYNGNLAGKSQIKEAVKDKGGNVTGVLRFSMIWNDHDDRKDQSDLDAWCSQPTGQKIGYNTGFRKDSGNRFSSCGGQLDIDERIPGGRTAVENIYFKDINLMSEGTYKFWVHQFSARNSKGFKAEIEFNGELYHYSYDKLVTGNVQVAEVTLKNGVFTIAHKLPVASETSNTVWGIDTNQFHKVNLVCLSPNHWGDNNTGNKHYFFMLDKCHSDVALRSFHNENLNDDLTKHRKVFEVLANTTMLEPTDKQLAGLGFNATVTDEIVVKVSGSHKRMLKITF